MGHDVDVEVSGGSPEHADVVESGPRWRAGWRWLAALALLGVALLVVVVNRRPGAPATAPTPPAAARTAPAGAPAASSATPQSTRHDGPILGITAGWELFGVGEAGLVRIEFARGAVTTTPVTLDSEGPVSLVVGADWTVIRPLDHVRGYVIKDGGPATPATGVLVEGAPAIPGPDQRSLWLGIGGDTLSLVGPDGLPLGTPMRLPDGMNDFPRSDATGYAVAQGTGGWYLVKPSGLRRITSGDLLAVGPTRWLVNECDERQRCGLVVIDRATGARRGLAGGLADRVEVPNGVISPDGRTAAIVEVTSVHLIDLASGSDRRIDAAGFTAPFIGTSMVWAPDSRWLFVARADGRLLAVVPATGAMADLGVDIPPMKVLSVRD